MGMAMGTAALVPLTPRGVFDGLCSYVSGLSEVRVSTVEEVLELLHTGAKHRAIRATEYNEVSRATHYHVWPHCPARHVTPMSCNTQPNRPPCCRHPQQSSRSHAVLQLNVMVESRQAGARRTVIRRAKLNLVDLAGSEKWNTAQGGDAMTGARAVGVYSSAPCAALLQSEYLAACALTAWLCT